ncbi:hypothetical protein OVS_00770 [Mycoplasma ovis str. Michigan]|uniref:Restriction endonuclease type II NgoFVII C-terminal B3-like DNA-binding domain-containing protein n=1 Tax=Mycoplasma ovis str. Michigan TaxID=1415773 RepID=A0ABN4BQK3_9MOLU|nr:restriction endonuclease PLD domain-containing protein [Mycoplasma ovis]AHC40144.1 hypothetical protein OVS_00770 [Mycoplasma ovis str. Michigan]
MLLKDLKEAEALRTITLPLIVPSEKEVLDSKELDLSWSALNACYSKPLVNEKTGRIQSWYDVQIIIEGEDNLPSRKEWFYLVTDCGFLCKACFAGKKVKWLSTFEDSEIIGGWIKSKLADEFELIDGFDYVYQDQRKWGVITKEVLEDYGGKQIILKKTNITKKDKKGIERDVWFISFPYKL